MAAQFLISFKLASVAQSGLCWPKAEKARPGWPLFGQWPLFELNSNFNAILHIQAHYSRLPTYFPVRKILRFSLSLNFNSVFSTKPIELWAILAFDVPPAHLAFRQLSASGGRLCVLMSTILATCRSAQSQLQLNYAEWI